MAPSAVRRRRDEPGSREERTIGTPGLGKRLVSGFSLALSVVALLALDGWLAASSSSLPPSPGPGDSLVHALCNGAISTAIVLVFAMLATRELLRFAVHTGDCRPFSGVAYFFGAGLVLGPFAALNLPHSSGAHDESWGMFWIALALAIAFLLQTYYRRAERAMVNLASTIFIIFYAGGLAGFMTKLRVEVGGVQGMALLLFSIFVVKMTDVGAYFVGTFLGRNKMIEWLSPKKTWEGLVGGVVVAVGCAVGIGLWLQTQGLLQLPDQGLLSAPGGLLLFGVLMAAGSVAGDLFASLLKRDAAMKDSGHSIPGMGGILDVLDSPLLAAPIAWFFWTRIVPQGG